jgi:uncharacterized protein (TIGR00369 family)
VQGLQLNWKREGTRTETIFYASKSHQGWAGFVHGGILAAILDEAITRLAWQNYGGAMTAEISVRYFNPARIGEKLTITAEIGKMKSRLIPGKAEIRNDKGRLIATATGKSIKPKSLVA